MKEMREGNDLKLDQMRDIVDKKLHETLERRLGESFKLVSDKIESVTKGINDVQNIVASVGDLKKVIANPKTKGVLGEYQLQMLIKDILIEGQYVENLGLKKTTNEDGRVEFAVKLPGEHKGAPVYLPIDAKYPTTEYDKLIETFNTGDKAAVDRAQAALESKIMSMAKDVSEYVTPPITADFAVMFLPFESLFAEVIRRPGLFERLKREHKVIITGPTTLAALLNALQVGFATLAVQQNASEMKELLVAVKADFDKFGNLLADTHEKLVTAAESIDDASKKTRTINNKLKKVEEIELE
jgi:DNA recombination protein RmuC